MGFWYDGTILTLNVVIIISLYAFVRSHQDEQLKGVNFTLKLYFNKVDFKIK